MKRLLLLVVAGLTLCSRAGADSNNAAPPTIKIVADPDALPRQTFAGVFQKDAPKPLWTLDHYHPLGHPAVSPDGHWLAITRTGILCRAPYEIVAHKRIGKGVGVTDAQNDALENWQAASCFDDTQRAALAFTDEIVTQHKPSDKTFNDIAARLTPAALVELQISVGFYVMTSKFLETFAIDMQPVADVV